MFKKFRAVLTPGQRKERRRQLLLVLLSGFLMGIAFPPFPVPVFIFFAFIPFFMVIEQREFLGSLNRFSYAAFFVFTLVTLYWVGSWTKEADPFLMISGMLLVFVNPALYLIPVSIYFAAKKSFGSRAALMMFPLFWVAFEFLYGLTDLRFPWLILGNSLSHFSYFIQIADIVGAEGLTLLILYINIFLYVFFMQVREKNKAGVKYAVVAVLLFIIPVFYGIYKIQDFRPGNKSVKVGLVQPNLDPWDKWQGGNINTLIDNYLGLSRKCVKEGAKVVIWPESALPVYFLSGNYVYEVDRLRAFVDSNNVFLLTGMPNANFYTDKNEAPEDAKPLKSIDGMYTSYNSILLFSPHNFDVQTYEKIKLVPFGEKVPFVEELPFLGDLIKWQVGISSWNVGKDTTVFNLPVNKNKTAYKINDELKIGGIVCIESIYPDFVAAFVQRGAQMIAVVTNDSWYGYSSGPFQHKEISVLRAVENRRSVVRAANGGISCIIDPLGRTVKDTKLFTRTYLVGNVELESGITFYTRFPLIIPLFSSFLSVFVLLYFIIKKIRMKFFNK